MADLLSSLLGDTRPNYQILANEADITMLVRDRLVQLTVKDSIGFDSDSLELVLDDRDASFSLPKMGGNLIVNLGYGQALDFMGMFVADEFELTGPERTFTIVARAADMVAGLKEPKERSWENTTIGKLVADIALEHGLVPGVSPAYGARLIEHLAQTNESDLHFLMRLARQNGAIAKPAGGVLLFVERRTAKSASGKLLNRVVLKPENVSEWRVRYADRNHYKSVIARYHDHLTGRTAPVRVGSGAPLYRIRNNFATLDQATDAAKSRLTELSIGVGKLELSMSGRTDIFSGSELDLRGFRNGGLLTEWKEGGVDGAWYVTTATHTVSGEGYRLTVEAEREP